MYSKFENGYKVLLFESIALRHFVDQAVHNQSVPASEDQGLIENRDDAPIKRSYVI
jgi:hypothetical protein